MPIKIQTLGDHQSPLAQRFGVPAVSDVQLAKASPDAVARLSAAVARSCRAVPIAIDQGALIVAFADPSDREALERVKADTAMPVEVAVAEYEAIEFVLRFLYPDNRT